MQNGAMPRNRLATAYFAAEDSQPNFKNDFQDNRFNLSRILLFTPMGEILSPHKCSQLRRSLSVL